MAAVAALIAPGRVTAGLLAVLADDLATVAALIGGEAAQPAREALRERFEAMAEHARALAEALADPTMRAWFHGEAGEAARVALRVIAGEAEARAAAIPARRGAGKAFPARDGLSAREVLAVRVAQLWWGMRGRRPAPHCAVLHDACEAAWRAAAGGGLLPRWGAKPSGWRTPIARAVAMLTAEVAASAAARVRTRDRGAAPADNSAHSG